MLFMLSAVECSLYKHVAILSSRHIVVLNLLHEDLLREELHGLSDGNCRPQAVAAVVNVMLPWLRCFCVCGCSGMIML